MTVRVAGFALRRGAEDGGNGSPPGGGSGNGSPPGGSASPVDKVLGSSSADSVPLPLMIVAALAILLLAAGAVGVANRHVQARRRFVMSSSRSRASSVPKRLGHGMTRRTRMSTSPRKATIAMNVTSSDLPMLQPLWWWNQ